MRHGMATPLHQARSVWAARLSYESHVDHGAPRHFTSTACDFLSSYDPPFISWGSYQKLPERAKKYLKGHDSFPGSQADLSSPSWRFSSVFPGRRKNMLPARSVTSMGLCASAQVPTRGFEAHAVACAVAHPRIPPTAAVSQSR
jgi:hypothetical protein